MHQMCRKEGVLMPVNVNEIEPDEKIVEIEMERLREFRNHPFKVKADGQMLQLIESISKYGVMNDLVIKEEQNEYSYELTGKKSFGKSSSGDPVGGYWSNPGGSIDPRRSRGSLSESTCHCHDCSCGSVVLLYVIFWW